MGNTLDKAVKGPAIADVVHFGEKMILPMGMSIDDGIDLLKRRKQYLQEDVIIDRSFDVFPWDGAHGFNIVLKEKYGWAPATAVQTMFGPNPPKMITIETSPTTKASIPWGKFELPNVKGEVHTTSGSKDGRVCFRIYAKIKRESEATVHELCDALDTYLVKGSIYRGQAIRMRFRNDEGNMLEMPEPKFIDTARISRDSLIYPDVVQNAVETNLFTPIERIQDCIANNIPIKRGILLGGTYGTGKTLAATVASKLCVDHGITYIYIPHADELADAINFSKAYQSPACVIFCEDIDREVEGERSVAMDDILNTIDGIESKYSNVITVLTTNHLEKVHPAMLRPGRLDAVIDVLPPDAKAVEKLLRLYGGDAIEAHDDLSAAGEALQGAIPAVIAEVVKRAKLSQLRRQEAGTKITKITGAALVEAAQTMEMQVALLKKQSEKAAPDHTVDKAIENLLSGALQQNLGRTADKVSEIHNHTVG